MRHAFITITAQVRDYYGKRVDTPVLVNVQHINTVHADGERTYVGINNYGAQGYKALESVEEITAMIAEVADIAASHEKGS